MKPGVLVNTAKLAIERKKGTEEYRRFQAYRASSVIAHLRDRGVELSGLTLDAGCGWGEYTRRIPEHFPAVQRVIGVDFQAGCVDRARELNSDSGLPLEFVQGDLTAIDYPEATFDSIICLGVIEHIPDRVKAAEEMFRVLKPGGLLVLSVSPFYSLHGGHALRPFTVFGWNFAIAAYSFLHRFSAEQKKQFDADYRKTLYPMSFADSRRLLFSSGFRIEKIIDILLFMRSAELLAHIPLLRELLFLHPAYVARKPKKN